MVKIAPSVLSADFSKLGQEVKKVAASGADMIHFDVMDGHFVPNLTFGADIVQSVRGKTDVPFDVHLMISHPGQFIESFVKAGADIITFHLECEDDIDEVISMIKKHKIKVGISVRPKTNINNLIPFLPMIDMVLVMSVEPGFGGQEFQKEALDKIAILKSLIGKKKIKIEVDGGINPVTAPACVLAGADILVAGSYIFHSQKYDVAIERLKHG